MAQRKTIERAREDAAEGKSPSTQAGEFVREEIEHIRHGVHGARSTEQAIAIGLSKARRAGVKLPPPDPSKTSRQTQRKAEQDTEAAGQRRKPALKRSRATKKALQHEGSEAASPRALSRHARTVASKRTRKERSAAAGKAAKTRASRRKSDK